jgi:osmoprotectant transport system permease protein
MKFFWLLPFLMSASVFAQEKIRIRVGSKIFTESYVTAEIIAQKLEELPNVIVERRFGLGATGIYLQAFENGDIDVGPEYTGTLSEVFLKNPDYENFENLKSRLELQSMTLSKSLGFNNTYGLATTKKRAEELGLNEISDLKYHPHLKMGLTHEFIQRKVGWRKLKEFYQLPQKLVEPMEHNLAYQALAEGQVDFIEVYTTDAKIAELHLQVLRDDKNFFPKYEGVILARSEFVRKYPEIWQHLKTLEGQIDEKKMIDLNSAVDLEKKSFAEAGQLFFGKKSLRPRENVLLKVTLQHLYLVLIPLLLAIFVGIPLGFLTLRSFWLGHAITLASSVVQTIPSLALLTFLIPLAGIGTLPALIALFLYSLLPILLGTVVGLRSIDSKLVESATALGLQGWKKIQVLDLPMALPSILNGIKTSLVFSIGTATLAALIGAGGYGNLIITGLATNDLNLILKGAIPAALMAILAQFLFSFFESKFISGGLRIQKK